MAGATISLKVATAVSLGAIIGAGIFVLSGAAISVSGPYSVVAFILVGIIMLMVALQLGELGSIMPSQKGASYSYANIAFGSELGFITGIMLFFAFSTEISVVSLGFGSYLASLLGLGTVFAIPFAILLIAALSLVNIIGISKAAKADFALVVVKIFILILFIIFGAYLAFGRNPDAISNITTAAGSYGLSSIFAASVAIVFAYAGFQSVSSFTGSVKGGSMTAAKAIIYSVVISMVLYTLVTVVLMLMVPVASYKLTGDPLSFALKSIHAPEWLFAAVDIAALIATASAALASILYSSRLLYQIGKDKLLPEFTRRFDDSRDVAVNGVIITSVIGVIMLFAGNIYTIASISNVGLFIAYLMVSFALIHFRRKGIRAKFRTPFYPYISVITIIALLVLFVGMPREALIIGMTLILSLMIIYYFLREANGKKPMHVKLFK